MQLSLRLALVLLLLLAGLTPLWLLPGSSRRSALPSESIRRVLKGQVRDATGPVAGARVRVKGATAFTTTDVEGRFRLKTTQPAERITAWKEGHVIGGTRPGSPLVIHLHLLPQEDHADYEWVDPVPRPGEVHNCGNCHAEIYREWSRSGHARSANGRHFGNLYEGTDWHGTAGVSWGLLTQYPDGRGVCTSCHAPTASGYDLRQVQGVAAQGVHCDYCHKVSAAGDGPIGLTHGRFNLQLLRPAGGQLFFGPLDDVDRGEDAYSPLYRDSRYCASCHEGVVFGVPVYTTYSEWRASPAARAGQQCQDCHMKPSGRMTNIAPGHGGIERDPHTLGNHLFFDGGQEAMLRRAVKVSASFERVAGQVQAKVRVWTEGAGHRVPTGFIDRNLLLVVEGRTTADRPLHALTGPRLPAPAGPQWAGQAGRLFARILRDPDGHSPAPFWLADLEPPVDTRLRPDAADESAYRFPAELGELRLRILYRRFWPEVVRAKKWPDADVVILDERVPCPVK
jgi:hypothetical protein